MKLQKSDKTIPMRVGNKGNLIPMQGVTHMAIYDGTYEVTPLPYAGQELITENKTLTQNIIINEIPYYEVSNEYGKTIHIGD